MVPLRSAAPVIVVGFIDQAVAPDEFNELVGTGADRQLTVVEVLGLRPVRGFPAFGLVTRDGGFRGFLGDDAQIGQLHRQQRPGAGGLDDQGIGVFGFNRFNRFGVDGERRRTVGHVGNALDGVNHIGGVEGGAVVKFDALAQLDFPGAVVGRRPGHRQTRLQVLVGVHFHQRLKNMPPAGVVGSQIVVVRVDGAGLGRQTNLQVGGQSGRGADQPHGQCADQRGAAKKSHCSPLKPPVGWFRLRPASFLSPVIALGLFVTASRPRCSQARLSQPYSRFPDNQSPTIVGPNGWPRPDRQRGAFEARLI